MSEAAVAGSERVAWPSIAATGSGPTAAMHVQRWDATRDGLLTASRLRQRLVEQGLWVSGRHYQPGESRDERPADHDSVEVVLVGLLQVNCGGESAILAAGDAAFVPRGVARHVEVIGSTPVVSYGGAYLASGPPLGRPRGAHSNWR